MKWQFVNSIIFILALVLREGLQRKKSAVIAYMHIHLTADAMAEKILNLSTADY